MPHDNILERYRDIVDDFAKFQKSCTTRQPLSCWVPAHRPWGHELLQDSGASRLTWKEDAFRDWTLSPAFVQAFLTGACVIQEEAAMSPIDALNLNAGESVLDLCAAPGNKTAQIASRVGWTGRVVANDVSSSRMHVLRGLVDRVGLPNVLMSNHNAADFPDSGFRYDAVVADVPCSCEGTSRKNPKVLLPQHPDQRTRLAGLQEKILRRAIRLTRPGGRIVYATCTFAPEENECVLNRVLSSPESAQEVELQKVNLPGLSTDKGLLEWNDVRFHPTMSRAVRIWPHFQDTGGFFFGILRKADGNRNPETIISADNDSRREAESIDVSNGPWSNHGLRNDTFSSLLTQTTGGKYDRLVVDGEWPGGLNEIIRGMTGLNRKSDQPRLSTSLAQFIGSAASAGKVQIAPENVLDYFQRQITPVLEMTPPLGETRFVIVFAGDIPLGLGHIPKTDETMVESVFPKNWGGLNVEEWIRSQLR